MVFTEFTHPEDVEADWELFSHRPCFVRPRELRQRELRPALLGKRAEPIWRSIKRRPGHD
jgi:hypothetical protein